jgi:hypothetical protein
MQRFSRKTLLAALLTIAWLGAAGVTPVAADDPPQERRGENRIRQDIDSKCAGFRRRYEQAKKTLEGARRGQVAEASDKFESARADYCKCLIESFEAAGLPLPEEYRKICSKPEAPEVPEEFRPDPATPDTQTMPGDPGASPTGGVGETPMDPCEKLAYDIKTLEELQEHYRKNNWKLPEPIKKKLARLKKEYAQCQKPGTGTAPEGETGTIGKPPTVPLPDKGKKPDTGSTGGTPNPPQAPPPGGGAFSPAGPGAQQSGCESLQKLFQGRNTHDLKLSTRFDLHNRNHKDHCDVCLRVINGVQLRIEWDPTSGCVVNVTVIDPPIPTITCQARPDGGFDCTSVTADFCELSPQVQIKHMKLAESGSHVGLSIAYPKDTLEICVNGRIP